ncbi:unnamed protein product, partial [Allacma fusca]
MTSRKLTLTCHVLDPDDP